MRPQASKESIYRGYSLCPFALLACLAVLLLGPSVSAEEPAYKFPEIKSEISLYGGYRFVELSGSERAAEYEYLRDSVAGRAELVAFPFPHRVHLDLEYMNRKDYFLDISYAYRDIVLSRVINRTLFHNLDNFELVDLDPGGVEPFAGITSPGVLAEDTGKAYGTRLSMNDLFLRLKAPNYPLHVYVYGHHLEKEGDFQQRFIGGSGWFDQAVRVSRKREIEWQTFDVTVGANSHLGPLEVDVSHTEKRFDSKGDRILSDSYGTAAFPDVIREGGVYPHNLVPDLDGSTNTLKLHTSYTGKIVASATLSDTDRENNSSGAKADYFMGAGEITWMPVTRLTVAVRYRHREIDVDNPDVIPANYLGFSSFSSPITDIRQSISSEVDALSGSMRYRLTKGVTLNLGYSYKQTDRTDTVEWAVPKSTTEQAVTVSATARVSKDLKIKGRYKHREIDNPAYNTQPEHSDSGIISVSWTPWSRVVAFAGYNVLRESRDGDFTTTEAHSRDFKRDGATGSLTFLLTEYLTLSTSYSYLHNEIEQDIFYGNISDPASPFADPGVSYRDTAHNYTAGLHLMPDRDLTLSAEISHTRSRGDFRPGNPVALDPVDIASLSDVRIMETEYSLSGDYRLKSGWGFGILYRFSDFDNRLDNPLNPTMFDGSAHIALVTLSKKW
jgi:hypothetical protein